MQSHVNSSFIKPDSTAFLDAKHNHKHVKTYFISMFKACSSISEHDPVTQVNQT